MAIDFKKLKHLKILGHDFDVEESNLIALSMGAIGLCYPAELKIVTTPDVPQTKREETLIHEIVEALNHLLELDLEHNKITSLASGLYQVFADNGLKFGK